MSLFKGKNLSVEIVGESHSSEIELSVKGFAPFKFDVQNLLEFTSRRKSSNACYSTKRKEDDLPIFFNVEDNEIKGDFKVIIKNNDVKSKDYSNLYAKPRPSHADYAWYLKDGALDFKGGGRFSARLTAPYCVLGGICKQYLESLGVKVVAYLKSVGNVNGSSYRDNEFSYEQLIEKTKGFPSIDKKEEMLLEIENAQKNLDSVGGIVEVVVYGMPCGVGDNLFEGLEGKISSLLFSIPAVKGVEFGNGFEMAKSFGSLVNDELYYDKNGAIRLKTNNNGGINGGISNGFNITMRVAIKPTPSIAKTQNTIDLRNKKNCKIEIKGRHDACVAVRAVPCIESAVMLALADEIM